MEGNRALAAAAAISSSMFLLAFFDNFVVMIARDLGLWQFHLMRSILAVAILGGLSWAGYVRLHALRRWSVMLRGGFAAVAMMIYFGCLAFLPIGQVAAGLFTAPIWVMLIMSVFFGQRIGPTRILAGLIGFTGVLIVLEPFGQGASFISFVPIASGLFYAMGVIATRQWCEGESAFSMLLYFFLSLGVFGLIGTIVTTALPHTVPEGPDGFILRGLVWPTELASWLTVMQAVGSMIAVGLSFKAYQLGDAAQVAIHEYVFLLFAAGWSYVLFGHPVGANDILGIALIILSGGVISIRSRNQSNPATVDT